MKRKETMSKNFPQYVLTEKQIRGIANIVLHEQGTIAGWYAEASQIANRTDIKGDSYATGENAVKTVTSGWYAKGKDRYKAGTNNATVIQIVKNVFCKGLRTLPRYINEHDCMSDISTAKNGSTSVKSQKSKWKKHTTIIRNRMGSTYTFYSFPGGYKTGVDPFGYTSSSYRKKWGEGCYTVNQAKTKKVKCSFVKFSVLTFPERGYFMKGDESKTVEKIQLFLKWAGFYSGRIDGSYGDKTVSAVKDFQRKCAFKNINGCFGKLCQKAAGKFKL